MAFGAIAGRYICVSSTKPTRGSRVPPCWMCLAPWEVSMRKSIILVVALIICGVLVGEAWALRIQLGHHSVREIRQTCAAVRGDFNTFSNGAYACTKLWWGGIGGVAASSNGCCTGDCPACGGPDQPVVRGGRGGPNAVTRVLNNFRTAKRYPAKRY